MIFVVIAKERMDFYFAVMTLHISKAFFCPLSKNFLINLHFQIILLFVRIEHISISRESIWNECQYKYKYRYHLDLKPPEEPIYFEYGKIVHKIIEDYTR